LLYFEKALKYTETLSDPDLLIEWELVGPRMFPALRALNEGGPQNRSLVRTLTNKEEDRAAELLF